MQVSFGDQGFGTGGSNHGVLGVAEEAYLIETGRL